MVRAYVLLTIEIGKVERVIGEIKAISGVIKADAVTGPYDAIVELEASDLGELTRKILHDSTTMRPLTLRFSFRADTRGFKASRSIFMILSLRA